ncbi:DUF2849 domain-containing protein [Phenylobacterium sp.]|uniref:DUF2849 domain-containing protein n=1 Tax=Phenylobacterium sp. TaxID=1871053 RepID=UPI0035B45CD1
MRALTANRLVDGEVVFWREGQWVERFADAQLFQDGDAAAEAAEAHGKNQPTVVVEPYLIDLMEAEGIWAPVSYRERIRALGPTNLAHGKQEEGGAMVEALLNTQGAARSSGRVNLIKRK